MRNQLNIKPLLLIAYVENKWFIECFNWFIYVARSSSLDLRTSPPVRQESLAPTHFICATNILFSWHGLSQATYNLFFLSPIVYFAFEWLVIPLPYTVLFLKFLCYSGGAWKGWGWLCAKHWAPCPAGQADDPSRDSCCLQCTMDLQCPLPNQRERGCLVT